MRRGSFLSSATLVALVLGVSSTASAADGDGGTRPPAETRNEARAIVDRIAVRFYAPETGGVTHPRFVTERILSFEGRLDAMSEETNHAPHAPDERHLKSALDRHIAEELLATLDETSEETADLARLSREVHADLEQRSGGDSNIWLAAEEEGLSPDEVQEVFMRRARAAAYLDRAVTRFLRPEEEQVREVYRTSQHPFRDRPFEDIRAPLARWWTFERLKALEATFLQTARSRVTVVIVPR